MVRSHVPVAMVVDDDPAALRRMHRQFLNETMLGVVSVKNLGIAADILIDSRIEIDALVADLFFDRKDTDPTRDLNDGLDLIRFASLHRKDMLITVVSVDADDVSRHRKARERGIIVQNWFSKLTFQGGTPPWKEVERYCLARILKHEHDVRSALQLGGSDIRDFPTDASLAALIASRVEWRRLSYLTDLGDAYVVKEPLKIALSGKNELHFAVWVDNGEACKGIGETPYSAVADLSALIVSLADAVFNGQGVEVAPSVSDLIRQFLEPKALG